MIEVAHDRLILTGQGRMSSKRGSSSWPDYLHWTAAAKGSGVDKLVS